MKNITNNFIIILHDLVNLGRKIFIYQVIFIITLGLLYPALAVLAVEPLTISNVRISSTASSATIMWDTNRASKGRIEYGLATNDYHWTLFYDQKGTTHAVTINNLSPDTVYYYRLTANDDTTAVVTFEQIFTTKKSGDGKAPEISDVHTAYITGHTITMQWFTDEPATSEIEYGLADTYGSTKKDSQLATVHDLTITGLVGNAPYHILVKSKDKDNNYARWYDLVVRTMDSYKIDNDDLFIYDVKPASENDLNVLQTSAVISWRTNKLSAGLVRYGTTRSLGKTVYANPPRDFTQNVTLSGLTAGTTYYFEVQVKDVFGKEVKSTGYTFTTKSLPDSNTTPNNYPSTGGYQQPSGQVLGVSTFDVNLEKDFGFYGLYYNLSKDRPDMNLWRGTEIPNSKIGKENDWYSPQYFVFNRVDQSLNFGPRFFPITTSNLPGDPYNFAVNWRAIIDVPKTDHYSYKVTCDDDCWIFVDNEIISNLGGVHPAKTDEKLIYLTEGYHKLEIFYAERSPSGAVFAFIPDARLKFHPLPDGYEITDVVNYNSWLKGGKVAGVKIYSNGSQTSTSTSKPKYVCNPDLGYSKFVALYKTANVPDVWAILENGQKHYITSPAAFNKYGCSWSDIKIVSQATLDKYPNVKLVKALADYKIYYLFQRAEVKWLKIHLSSPTVFVSYPNNYWGNVATIDELDIQAYPDVKLVKTKYNPTVYLLENGLRRPIKSAAVFSKYNYNWAEVCQINSVHLGSFQEGSVLE